MWHWHQRVLWHVLCSFFAKPYTIVQIEKAQNMDKVTLNSQLLIALLSLGRCGGWTRAEVFSSGLSHPELRATLSSSGSVTTVGWMVQGPERKLV